MTPPRPEPSEEDKAAGSAAAFLRLETLRKRPEFTRLNRGRKQATPGFILQAAKNGDSDALRVGFTCSKKVGNAVARNRAKRRLRALARSVLPENGKSGWDYVLIGRARETASRNFAQMQDDLSAALAKIHGA